MGRRIRKERSAREDADEAIDHLVDAASLDDALRFADELERAFELLAEHPAMGRACVLQALQLQNLRKWPLRTFPYLVYYRFTEDELIVHRIVHGAREQADALGDEPDED